jgi:hypothetical protein
MGGVEIEFTEERDYMEGLIPDDPSTCNEMRKEEIVDINDL